MNRPNVIVIIADDMGYGDIESYGGSIKTPNIDRLISGGMKFTDFHSSGPVCSPTRAGFVTGRYQQRAGIEGVLKVSEKTLHDGLCQSEVALTKLLQSSDYRTALFGKWHLGYKEDNHPLNHGFHEFKGYIGGNIDYISHYDQVGDYDWWHGFDSAVEEGYVTHLVNNHVVDFIQRHAEGNSEEVADGDNIDSVQPFFICAAHEAPHYPYQGPNDKADRGFGHDFPVLGSREDRQEAYREMVEEMDKGIGDILDILEEKDLTDNTMIIFFSDNGACKEGCNLPFRDGKASLYEGGHRVPMVIKWPGMVDAGSVNDSLTISIDLMPTVVSACGIDIPENLVLDGIDLTPYITGYPGQIEGDEDRHAKSHARKLFWRFEDKRAMRFGRYKMVKDGKALPYELYDMTEDPTESKDISEEHEVLLENMIDDWKQWNSQFK